MARKTPFKKKEVIKEEIEEPESLELEELFEGLESRP